MTVKQIGIFNVLKEIFMFKSRLVFKAVIFIFMLYFISAFIWNEKYNCNDNCIFHIIGQLSAVYLLAVVCFVYVDKYKKKAFLYLKLYAAGMFVLYSGLYYIDTKQYELDLNAKKDYITFHSQLASIEPKKIDIDISKKIADEMVEYNKSFKQYEDLLNGYKDIIGRAMIGLMLGLFIFFLLDVVEIKYVKARQFDKIGLSD